VGSSPIIYKARPAFLHQYAAHFTTYNHALVAQSVRVGQGNQCNRSALGVLSGTVLPSQAKPSQAKQECRKKTPSGFGLECLLTDIRNQEFGSENSLLRIRPQRFDNEIVA
jgi:hypothetical protein